ncbi:MAG: hypothetical protein BWY21_02130 [Parcubacteria group bacterium ADurb.Bin216]|nr:MAG: hypothetical protein BWY21_02130 [Parcubacteria group bacterium ADurb.Bin216]
MPDATVAVPATSSGNVAFANLGATVPTLLSGPNTVPSAAPLSPAIPTSSGLSPLPS